MEVYEGMFPTEGIDLKAVLRAFEKGIIRRALREAEGNIAQAAVLLKMKRTTLSEKAKRYQLLEKKNDQNDVGETERTTGRDGDEETL